MQAKAIPVTAKNRLFKDYVTDFNQVREFYQIDFRNEWQKAIDQRRQFKYHREELSDLILSQHKKWDADDKTTQNIEKLKSENTLAIVTGQQAGVFGGPLYTIYKTITILKLSRWLEREFPEHQFVPIFWMEVNDNDFEEINSIHYFTRGNEIRKLTLEESPQDALKPIAARHIDEQIQQWRKMLDEDFFDTEFKKDVITTFFSCYQPQENFADAFARLLLKLFGQHGLILFDPSDSSLGSFVKPLYQKALQSTTQVAKTVRERTEALDQSGYAAQIQFRPQQTMLFYHDQQQGRIRIDINDEGEFALKYPEGYSDMKRDELLKECEETPAKFSPNVALRPIAQDFILPTVAYVAGPAEIAYFGQLEALYRLFDIPMPVIYPRHQLTLVEGKIQKIIEKYDLDYTQILDGEPDFIEKTLQQGPSKKVFEGIESAEFKITEALETLSGLLEEIDPTLLNTLKKTRNNIQGNFNKLSSKITRSLEEKNKTQVRQLERALMYLMPDSTHQERLMNIIYYYIKYGSNFIEELYEALPEKTDQHYIVEL